MVSETYAKTCQTYKFGSTNKTVAYFDQQIGAADIISWSKYAFVLVSTFLPNFDKKKVKKPNAHLQHPNICLAPWKNYIKCMFSYLTLYQ